MSVQFTVAAKNHCIPIPFIDVDDDDAHADRAMAIGTMEVDAHKRV